MTVFAGMIRLDETKISLSEYSKFKASFKKSSLNDITFEKKSQSSIIFSYDIGAYLTSNVSEKSEITTIIAGDPLIRTDPKFKLDQDIALINDSFITNQHEFVLKKAKGVFSGVSVNTKNNTTFLFTDKLGIRPIYYYKKDNIVIFSSLMSLFEDIDGVDLSIDFQGMCEQLAFGFCLANRTQHTFIKRMDVGEIIEISNHSLHSRQYWDWCDIPVTESLTPQQINELYLSFDKATQLRLAGNTSGIAFLSGGLDSRVIAASVKSHVKELFTFNFSAEKSQDVEYARLFAEAAELTHHEKVFTTLAYPNWTQLMSDVIVENKHKFNNDLNQQLVWSGDGGSVSVGYVYIDEDIHQALNEKNIDRAVSLFLAASKTSIPTSFFKQEHSQKLDKLLENSIAKEFLVNPNDAAKSIYYFLMNNDQKRHLNVHFETICHHKTELHLPFFDSDFLEKIYAIPSNDMLYHKLYMKWFDYFPDCTRKTPWQTYPKHVACPIKNTQDLSYQWDKNKKNEKKRKEDFKYFLSIKNNKFIFQYFKKYKVFAAMLFHRAGIRDYTHIIDNMKALDKMSPK